MFKSKTMKKLIFISLIAISLFSVSCTEETGGNADMTTVDFIVQNTDWVEFGNIGEQGYGFAVDLNFPEITSNVINNGMVTLYIKRGESWTPIPFNYFYLNPDGVNYEGGYFYSMKTGIFSIDYYESDYFTENPGTQIFRLVIVQPI
jgi:hypothetical protein